MGISRDEMMELADEMGLLEDPEERFLRELEEEDEDDFCDEDYDYDGQPDEMTEWLDFDPDC